MTKKEFYLIALFFAVIAIAGFALVIIYSNWQTALGVTLLFACSGIRYKL